MNIKLILILLMFMPFGEAFSAKLYKWIDENGQLQYSDRIPPDQMKNAREVLNEHGIVIDQVKRELTEEEKELVRSEFVKEQELEQQRVLELERVEKDRKTILKSYVNTDQIIRLKSERLAALKRNIEMAEDNIVIQKKNHEDLLKRAADKERNGEVVSAGFLQQIEKIKGQIKSQKQYIIDKTVEIEVTEEKYRQDLEKFKKYTGQS
ncbi:MAG: DUF4124 domain-containing protein [Proteobacteria bacterium]|nr:DUF4124 domain-containing protein [Pseudomonadota bacterium]